LVVVLGFVLLAQPALGAESDKATAKAHYEAATRLYDIKEWAKALEAYKAAYLSKPDPAFLFNIGQCYRKLGRQSQALEFYKEYLKKTPPDDPNRTSVEGRVREMEAGDLFETDVPRITAPPGVSIPAPLVREEPTQELVAEPPPAGVSPAGYPSTSAHDTPPETEFPAPLPTVMAQPARTDLTSAEPVRQESGGSRFYKTWWFWTGVCGAVVAGTVVGIVAASGGNHGNTANTALGTQAAFQ
jgi:tetratricopeptide (TPR) repeat protein